MDKLLIVDDEINIVEGLKVMLDWNKYGISHIYSATSYEEAISIALKKGPSLIILDMCIDNVLGTKIIEKLEELGVHSDYIIISGHSDFQFVRKSMQLGAWDYLLKPIHVKDLKETLNRILQKQGLDIPVEDEKGVYKNGTVVLNKDRLSGIIIRVLIYVEEYYMQNITLMTIAEKFKINATYLAQLFLKETGIRFSQFLLAHRMEKARELIQTTDYKIAAICADVGYTNINYFYKHFKEFFHTSPTELRKG